MYKVLLVDDERIILDGIARMVDWPALGCKLAGTAKNGLEAMDFISKNSVDIVISDIRMPGMDGLQLVEAAKELAPSLAFILLSGFDEFEYARIAMRFGVKHYLLKPCNEGIISQAISEVIVEFRRRESKEQFVRKNEQKLQKMLPYVKEQFLKELLTNKTYGIKDWNEYCELFHMAAAELRVRLILLQIEGVFDFEHLFALRNISKDILGDEVMLLDTTIGKQALLLIRDFAEEALIYGRIALVKTTFYNYYNLDITIALSEPHDIANAREMYRKTLECLKFRFYLGEGSIITPRDIASVFTGETDQFIYDEDELCMLVKSGRWEDAKREIAFWFEKLAELKPNTAMAKSYILSLYAAIIRQGDPANMGAHLQELNRFDDLNTLQTLREFLESAARSIARQNYEQNLNRHSAIVEKMLAVIEENLGNPQLSLLWVAREMLYMNEDYLGKLFKKEIGYKFSAYVTKLRMEKAIRMIETAEDVKVYELAEMLGYGGNAQYFGQVFKKYTGCTPSEYKKKP
ncbi:MAG TPA: response regulator transcription factor [Bacilli bacterium]